MSSGKYISLTSVILNANKDISLNSGQNLDITSREYKDFNGNTISTPYELEFMIKSDDPKLRTQIHAGENLLVNVSNDINSEGAKFSAGNSVSLLAGNSLNLLASIFPVKDGWNNFGIQNFFGKSD
ncbi:hemagglutinin repeat-containing protein [Xenorhabdus indica]|nr:hemagglutinin repeat-containing protein [Xenorhabdus indica]